MVELKMSSETERGPGQWVLNVSILNDHKFREMITNDWIEFQDYYDDFENLLDWWDAAKAMVRSVAMFYSQHKKGIENKLRNELKSERVRLEAVTECSPDENNIQALRIINSRERELEMESIEGHRIRARLPSFEDGEPNISLYAKMEKYRAERNSIDSLYNENSDIQTGTENVLRVAQKYYEKLYTAEETDKSMQNQILSKTTAKITNEQKNV